MPYPTKRKTVRTSHGNAQRSWRGIPPQASIGYCHVKRVEYEFDFFASERHSQGEGNVDIGVTGIDIVEENSSVEVQRIMDLGFGKCSLCVQAPVISNITDVKMLAGKRIVTSFPNLTKK
ncbi:hypothetical protein ACHAXN_002392 [Cyclotella atomus]